MNRAARRTPAGRAALRGPTPWHGRRGVVVLGPTEDRVARYLDHMTRHGRVTLRTLDVVGRLAIERSEVYRITRRLRVLGLFGIENDQGGTRGGRRYWRTEIQHDGAELDRTRHRDAWARVVGWCRATSGRVAAAAAARRPIHAASALGPHTLGPALAAIAGPSYLPPGSGPPSRTFAELMRAAGLGPLMDEWRVAR